MNDDSPTPEAELASAVLDNEAQSAERAHVTATPALNEELQFYTEMRARLADVAVPEPRREAAFAAALAVFDDLQRSNSGSASAVGAPVGTGASVVSLDQRRIRRQRQYRWLGGAAAAALVLVVAIGALGSFGRGDDSKSADVLSGDSTAAEKSVPSSPADAGQVSGSSDAAAAPAPEAAPAPQIPQAAPADPVEDDGIEINGPAEVNQWALAPSLASEDDVVAFVTSTAFSDEGQLAPVLTDTAPAGGTDSAATSEAASESPVTAPTGLPATGGGDSEEDGSAVAIDGCLSLYSGPSSPAIFQGMQVFVILLGASNEAVVINPVGCDVLTIVALP